MKREDKSTYGLGNIRVALTMTDRNGDQVDDQIGDELMQMIGCTVVPSIKQSCYRLAGADSASSDYTSEHASINLGCDDYTMDITIMASVRGNVTKRDLRSMLFNEMMYLTSLLPTAIDMIETAARKKVEAEAMFDRIATSFAQALHDPSYENFTRDPFTSFLEQDLFTNKNNHFG